MTLPLKAQALFTSNALANLSQAIANGQERDLLYVGKVIGEHAQELRDAALEAA